MKKYEGLRALYVGSHPLFTEGASAVHMMKNVPGDGQLGNHSRVRPAWAGEKGRLFSYYA